MAAGRRARQILNRLESDVRALVDSLGIAGISGEHCVATGFPTAEPFTLGVVISSDVEWSDLQAIASATARWPTRSNGYPIRLAWLLDEAGDRPNLEAEFNTALSAQPFTIFSEYRGAPAAEVIARSILSISPPVLAESRIAAGGAELLRTLGRGPARGGVTIIDGEPLADRKMTGVWGAVFVDDSSAQTYEVMNARVGRMIGEDCEDLKLCAVVMDDVRWRWPELGGILTWREARGANT